MFINDISSDSKIELQCVSNARQLMTLEATSVVGSVDKLKKRHLYVTPFYYDGKLLSFNSVQCIVKICDRRDGRFYLFKADKVSHIHNPHGEGVLAMVDTEEDAKPLNFRRAPRIACNFAGTIQVFGAASVSPCKICDVSTVGVGVLVTPDVRQPQVGNNVVLDFVDPELCWHFTLNAHVARIVPLSSGQTLVGCELAQYYDMFTSLCHYRRSKQRNGGQ